MKYTHILAILATSLAALPASGQFRSLWILGEENGGQGEFAQESLTQNDPPGSPTTKDDDYYFAGDYVDTVGLVEVDEPTNAGPGGNNSSTGTLGYERAIAHNDPTNRIHFILTAGEVNPDARYRFRTLLQGAGEPGAPGTFGTHEVSILFNDNEVYNSGGALTEDTPVEQEFSPAEVNAVAGENVITITRTNSSVSGWIQTDFAQLEIDESGIACTEPICNFVSDKTIIQPGEEAVLSWLTDSTATLSIDNGVGNVTAGVGSASVFPTKNTTYTLSSTRGADSDTATATVNVDLLFSFTNVPESVTLGDPTATLEWEIQDLDGVTVEIDQGIGDVTSLTDFGTGSVEVSPTEETTYTITVTRPNTPTDDVETATVTVGFDDSLIFDFITFPNEVTPENPDSTLEWNISNADGVTAMIEPGLGDIAGDTSNGIGFRTISLTEDTTYTLTVTLGGRTETRTVDVFYNDFTELWQIGENDDARNEFAQESLTSNLVTEGSPTELDDDYYITGTYPAPIGTLATDEVLTDGTNDRAGMGFERALLPADPTNRIHFTLDGAQAEAANEILLTIGLVSGGFAGGGGNFGIHDISISMNDQLITEEADITEPTTIRQRFTTASVNAVEGENIIEITRTGGDSADNGGNAGWIQFDFLRAELRNPNMGNPIAPPLEITSTVFNSATNMLTITFPSTEGEIFEIQESSNLTAAEFESGPLGADVNAATSPATETSVDIDTSSFGAMHFFRVIKKP